MSHSYNVQADGGHAYSQIINELAVASGRATNIGLFPAEGASYIVSKLGSAYYIKNGVTGAMSPAFTDLGVAVNSVIANGVKIKIMDGGYNQATTIGYKHGNIIEGESTTGVIIYPQTPGMTCFARSTAVHMGFVGLKNFQIQSYGTPAYQNFTGINWLAYHGNIDNVWVYYPAVGISMGINNDIEEWIYFNTINNCRVSTNSDNAIGLQLLDSVGPNMFVGGDYLGDKTAGSIGILVNGNNALYYPGTNRFYGVSVGVWETGIKLGKCSTNLFSSRIENCTYGAEITNNADQNLFAHFSMAVITANQFFRYTGGATQASTKTRIKDAIYIGGSLTERNVLSGTFAIDSTGLKSVTITHGLFYTPPPEDVQATIVEDTDVDDWWGFITKVKDITDLTLTVDIYVLDASATGGATAKVSIKIGGP